ncbi:MAG: CHASE2 domain-containing protein [Desulfocapsaceae bacterium]
MSKKAVVSIAAIGIIFSFIIGISYYFNSSALTEVDNFFHDLYVKKRATGRAPQSVTVADIDDASLSVLGQWPWPRYRIAELVQIIGEMNPAAIGIDILFSEPDRTSLLTIKDNFQNDFGLDITFGNIPDGLSNNDGYLGAVLNQTGAVGAHYLYFDHLIKNSRCREQSVSITDRAVAMSLFDASAALCNIPEVETKLHHTGFINNQLDDDGRLRRVPVLIRHQGQIHPNLSLAAVMHSLGVDAGEIESDLYGPVLTVGSYKIPLTADGFVSLKFQTPAHQLNTIPVLDIFNHSIERSEIEGKIVFIGSSAAVLNDLVQTALDPTFPGVQAHAVLTGNILNSELIVTPAWSRSLVLVSCLLAGLIMVYLFTNSSGPFPTLLGTLTLAAFFIALSYLLFIFENAFISPGPVVITASILFAFLSAARFSIEKRNAFLWLRQLSNTQQVTMESMATVAETRDPETGAHIERTKYFVKAIAEALKRSGHFSETLTRDYISILYLSAPLHDIGKVGVPDKILLKPGKLSEAEFEQMKKHTEYGHAIIARTVRKIKGDNFLKLSGDIAYSHHEKWDGSGYPRGLKAEEIPLPGRIMIVADVYDALTNERCYKPAFSHRKAIDIMLKERGVSFDPIIFDAFMRIEDQVIAISHKYSDKTE